jgi:nitrogenase-stabilizing/protective protein
VIPASLPELGQLERAEEFFEALGVPYDPRVVTIHRMQLLRILGAAFASMEPSLPFLGTEALRAALRGALREAHETLARGQTVIPPGPGGRLVKLGRPPGR